MSITVKLPDELAAILAGEAARRSLTLPVDTGALLAAAPEGRVSSGWCYSPPR